MKLIRDNIHNFIEDKNLLEQLEKSNVGTYTEFLEEKLKEETAEVIEAPAEKKLEELADVYEVLLALGAKYGHGLHAIQAFADQKRATLGGFREGWILK
jgi:predicted house-cleaning noncanonical NTP pyrophosphatase (MazG superfamily)